MRQEAETASWCSEGREPWVVRGRVRETAWGCGSTWAWGACSRISGAPTYTGVWVSGCVQESVFGFLGMSVYV